MADNLDLYPNIRRTNAAYFGLMGGVDMAEGCPLEHGKCAPDRGPPCEHFMGHLHRDGQAFVGDRTPICCAVLLRRLLDTERPRTEPATRGEEG
jgi:hypothetical protein